MTTIQACVWWFQSLYDAVHIVEVYLQMCDLWFGTKLHFYSELILSFVILLADNITESIEGCKGHG
jgi:hypothetical protein